jgi:hypothetical protein
MGTGLNYYVFSMNGKKEVKPIEAYLNHHFEGQKDKTY